MIPENNLKVHKQYFWAYLVTILKTLGFAKAQTMETALLPLTTTNNNSTAHNFWMQLELQDWEL